MEVLPKLAFTEDEYEPPDVPAIATDEFEPPDVPCVLDVSPIGSEVAKAAASHGWQTCHVLKRHDRKLPHICLRVDTSEGGELLLQLLGRPSVKLVVVNALVPSVYSQLAVAATNICKVLLSGQAQGKLAVVALSDRSPLWRLSAFQTLVSGCTVWRGCSCTFGTDSHLLWQFLITDPLELPPSGCPLSQQQRPNLDLAQPVAAKLGAFLIPLVSQWLQVDIPRPPQQRAAQAAVAGRQHKLALVSSPFAEVVFVQVAPNRIVPFLDGRVLTQPIALPCGRWLPKGSRVLSKNLAGAGEHPVPIRLGVPWSPEQFMVQLEVALHPFDSTAELFAGQGAIQQWLTASSPVEVRNWRLKQVARIKRMARDLELDEKLLHQGMAPSVSRVLNGKRILLFRELLKEAGHPDLGVAQELEFGFQMVGNLGASPVFQSELKPAALSIDDLKRASSWVNPMVLGRTALHEDPVLQNS
eukprot:6473200-Amphidinium_carterae.2